MLSLNKIRIGCSAASFLLLTGCGNRSSNALSTTRDNETSSLTSIGPNNFVLVKAGAFWMGHLQADLSDGIEGPHHHVTLSADFEIGKFEVTQQEWFEVMGTNPSFRNSACSGWQQIDGVALCPQHPVENVSWDDVQIYITKLKEKGLGEFRLPTEAEWEYAARGGTYDAFPYASAEQFSRVAWHDLNSGRETHPVGQLQPNHFGLYDTAGNVSEWVWDTYAAYTDAWVTNPYTSGGYHQIARGGHFWAQANSCRAGTRSILSHNYRLEGLGFRLVRR